jgi:hypothetical protein
VFVREEQIGWPGGQSWKKHFNHKHGESQMKISKKFFVTLGLVMLLAATLVTTAFASDTKVVNFANVSKVQVLDNQPATFSLLGSYTCDQLQVNAYISGKTIYINAYDVKIKHTGRGCDNDRSYKRTVQLGNLVPGVYTVLINANENGQAAKKIKNFVAPLLPVATSGSTHP